MLIRRLNLMNLSAEHIHGLAAETGFRPETLEQVIGLDELSPVLLFPEDEELANRLTRYPALLWKIKNVKRDLSK